MKTTALISCQEILIYGLACFRLSVMLMEDTGPWKMFTLLRSWLKREAREHKAVKKSDVAHGIECGRCNSVWTGIPIAAYAILGDDWPRWIKLTGDLFLLSMALSAMSILWHRAFPKR